MTKPKTPSPPKPAKPPKPRARCFQCDLDIPHVCYQDVHGAKWGVEG